MSRAGSNGGLRSWCEFAEGMWQGLICLGAGIAVAVPAYVGHNFLVSRLNDVLLEMETSSTEMIHLLSGRSEVGKS